MKYEEISTIWVFENKIEIDKFSSGVEPYKDSPESQIFLGYGDDVSKLFTGFIYSFEIFTSLPEFSDCFLPECINLIGFDDFNSKCFDLCSDTNTRCFCDVGYTLVSGFCERTKFKASLHFASIENTTLEFEEQLKDSLKFTDIKIFLNEKEVEFRIQEINLTHYNIKFSSDLIIKDDKKYRLEVKFLSMLISINESLLETENLKDEIRSKPKSTESNIFTLSEKHLKNLVLATIGLSVGTSFLFFDPSSFFNLLNLIELFACVIIYDVTFDIKFISFILSMQGASTIPDIFGIFINNKSKLPSKYSNASYDSSLFLLNSGMNLVVLVGTLMLIPLSLFLRIFENRWIQNIRKQLDIELRYSAFIRFFIQTCFVIQTSSLISIKFTKNNSTLEFSDQILSYFLLSCN